MANSLIPCRSIVGVAGIRQPQIAGRLLITRRMLLLSDAYRNAKECKAALLGQLYSNARPGSKLAVNTREVLATPPLLPESHLSIKLGPGPHT